MKQSEILKAVKSVGGNEFNFDVWYAECWSKKRGSFSSILSANLIKYLKKNRKVVGSILDICSGSGEFISSMRNICSDCVGIDTADAYLTYAKSRCHDVDFKKVNGFADFKLKRKFDLISCNGDVVNMFTLFEDWEKFFKTVYSHLNKGGMFLFDFYKKETLDSFNGVIYEESDEVDYVSKRSQNNGLCVMSEVYYLKESSQYYRKTADIMVETGFELEVIKQALINIGFKDVKVIDNTFTELSLKEIKELKRLHIICTK